MTERTERVGDLIRAELSQLFLRELRDPRVGLATVTYVEVTRDLGHATVRISALGTEEERSAAVAALEHAKGFLRRELARRLTFRSVPELHFVLDRGPEHSQQMSDLLDRLKKEAPDADS